MSPRVDWVHHCLQKTKTLYSPLSIFSQFHTNGTGINWYSYEELYYFNNYQFLPTKYAEKSELLKHFLHSPNLLVVLTFLGV